MAINKNFVIKNGVQVDTDLIVGDSNTKKVGIGTTVPEYTLHVGATNAAGRGGIGATDLNVTGVGTVQNLNVLGLSTFAGNASVSGIVSAQSFGIGSTEIIDRGMRLSGIASLDATTIATIEEAIRVGPNSFSDLKVSGISTFIGIATFLGGIDVNIRSGVSTFSSPVQFGFAQYDSQAGLSSNFVAVGATVGFGTSAFFRDGAGLHFGNDSDLKIWHEGSNSYIQDVGTGDLIIQGSADIKLQSASGENYLIANDTGSVDIYFDNSKKVETTSGGLKVTGITTLTDRLFVEAGISTFVGDVRFGIGATVGFGTSAFFRDDAAIFLGNDLDLKIHHDGSNSYVEDIGTGDLILKGSSDIKLQSASGESYIVANDTGSVEVYYDNSKKLESTSGGLNITGITTFSDRINVVSGVSTFQDNAKLTFGTQADLTVYHNGTDSFITNKTGALMFNTADSVYFANLANNENYLVITDNGSVDIYYDNSKKLETTSGGLNVTGITTFSDRINVVSGVSTFQDNAKLTFGGQGDLLIYHDASHSYITNATGDLNIQSGTTDPISVKTDDFRIYDQAGSDVLLRAYADGGIFAYYDNSNVFQTTPQGVNVSGVTTTNRLLVSGISTFSGNLDINASIDVSGNTVLNGDVDLGNATGDTITATGRFDSDIVPSTDNARDLGASGLEFKDLYIDGTANIDSLAADTAAIGDLTDNRVVIAGSAGELEGDGNFTFDGNQLKVGLGTIQVNGNAAFAGIVTIGGNLNVTGDIVYDEVSGRNLNISGITTLGSGNGGVSGLQVTGAGYVGGGATVGSNGPGIVTYYGDGGNLTGVTIGIGTTGDGSAGLHPVGYGATFLVFKGAGFTTAYYDGNLGIATLCFQGGGNAGAAGTWVPYGNLGIATSKSVGVGTVGMGVTSLQGGVKGASSGIGNSFSGLYIGNGMMVVDNALNGNHYIGTSYNGLMAGPVTINGVLTVDGNYVVV